MAGASSRAECAALDASDPLAAYRDEFVVPDDSLVYVDGNSLGRLPKASAHRVSAVLAGEWGDRLIRSWRESWMGLPVRIGDMIATGLLGAQPGTTIVSDNTTVSLYKALGAALDARPDRVAILVERDAFPTDRYLVESLATQRGLEIRWVADAGPAGLTTQAVETVLDDRVGVALLSHVDYRSAAIADLAEITALLHDSGALAIWDLCHSVGAVPIDLPGSHVDIAVGCTYKYLNGGPGAPAFTYVDPLRQGELGQPIWGWWGRADMFEMGPGYQRQPDIRSWLTGTPGVLSLCAVGPAVEMVVRAGMEAIRCKSRRLTALALELYDDWLAELGMGFASPRDPDRRGSHVTITHPDASRLVDALTEDGVVPDFRRPDGIRIGLSPLTTRFVDVWDCFAAIRRLAGS